MEPAPDAPDEARVRQVRRIFSTISDRYDFLNHFLSAGRDIAWRRFMVRRLRFFRTQRLLDLATGTGDVAIEAARIHPHIQVLGLDFAAPISVIELVGRVEKQVKKKKGKAQEALDKVKGLISKDKEPKEEAVKSE